MKFCFGILIMVCQAESPPVVTSDFCSLTRSELSDMRLAGSEVQALNDTTVRKLASLRRKYKRLCAQPTK